MGLVPKKRRLSRDAQLCSDVHRPGAGSGCSNPAAGGGMGSRLETFPAHSLTGWLRTRSTRAAMEVAAHRALPKEHPALRTQISTVHTTQFCLLP